VAVHLCPAEVGWLGGLDRVPGNAAETEDGGDQGNDEKRYGPAKHGSDPFSVAEEFACRENAMTGAGFRKADSRGGARSACRGHGWRAMEL